jgi:hypothetical protein
MKLTDTELVMLSRAAQRDDRAVELPTNLKPQAAEKIVGKLLKGSLVDEVRASGSLPVWRRSEGEGAFALLVTPAGLRAIGTEEEPRSASRKAAQRAQAPRRSNDTSAAKRKGAPQRRPTPKATAGSKQDKILDLLRPPQGATIPVLMKATGWQAHSLRGFFAGTVRKKLKLKLTSDKGDGDRVYRIAQPRKPPKRSSGKRAA